MSRALIIVEGPRSRAQAQELLSRVPVGTRVEFKASKRSLPQNDRMWAMLTDIASQKGWHGVKIGAADWKLIFLDALAQELRVVPNLNGNGFVNLGRSSSDLSKEEMSNLIELIAAWAAQNGVTLHDEKVAA